MSDHLILVKVKRHCIQQVAANAIESHMISKSLLLPLNRKSNRFFIYSGLPSIAKVLCITTGGKARIRFFMYGSYKALSSGLILIQLLSRSSFTPYIFASIDRVTVPTV